MDNSRKFQSIISTILQIPEEQVNDDLTPEKVDTWDSLNHINLIGALEQEFSITLATNHLDQVRSVSALKKLLADQGITI